MVTSIIFSKDRPLQLDLCLNSIKKNFTDSTQNIVLYNNSKEFSEGHETLKTEHGDVEFWAQGGSLFKDVYQAIAGSQNKYICFFTDDDIVFSQGKIYYEALDNPHLTCVSLRMGLNICERWHDGMVSDDLPIHIVASDECMIWWQRTIQMYGSYWSYSLSVDGHIFRKQDMLEMMEELVFLEGVKEWKQTPNELESAIQRFWTITPGLMAAPRHSMVVNTPNNRVQDTHIENRSGDEYDYTPQLLLHKYLSGQRIRLESLDFNEIKCPHTEIDILKGLK